MAAYGSVFTGEKPWGGPPGPSTSLLPEYILPIVSLANSQRTESVEHSESLEYLRNPLLHTPPLALDSCIPQVNLVDLADRVVRGDQVHPGQP